ncbi:hypothetical protein [Saccharothrix xinjiangensis]|uniref:Uncharacterized protein n=1 Tax=Saccharothrix xinjiangensis TaxID=204798 RepID=A0ABV9Y3Z8_9PSEU
MRRLLLCAALVLGFTAAPAITGTSVAGADSLDCKFYLFFEGFSGKLVDIGCASGANGDAVLCDFGLQIAGVQPQEVIDEACRRAALP